MYQKIVTLEAGGPKGSHNVWVLRSILNQGGFGVVYETTNETGAKENMKFVTKCLPHKGNIGLGSAEGAVPLRGGHILNEKRIYESLTSDLQHVCFIPEILAYGSNCIIMEKFDMDVDQYLNTHTVPRKTIHCFISQVLKALEFIHKHNYSHGDIKTSNMLLDLKDVNNPIIKISDFGLSASFVSQETSKHLDYCTHVIPHRGTLLFISEDAHRGIIPSRRSDLENLGWVMIHSFFKATLPWKYMYKKQRILNEKVRTKTLIQQSSSVKKLLPNHSTTRLDLYFIHILRLKYDECPKYKMLIDLF